MEPRIELLKQKKIVGIKTEMTFLQNKTAELWQSFMPRRNEVPNRIGTNFISMQIYGENLTFSPTEQFTKYAAVEVSSFVSIPSNMVTHIIEGGQYAVFIHKGPASSAPKTMQHIFGEWLPKSEYELDTREHFELLPENYNPMDEDAEEEVWIPIKKK